MPRAQNASTPATVALTAAGVANEFQIYAGAPHAFFNDTRASYRPEAAADAWARLLAWLEEYL